jgi:uncharacterized membrane protein YdjX (TVP38/TMEM64 family)
MKHELTQHAVQAAQSPKTGGAVAVATATAGASTYLSLIPTILGIVASMMGITLSSIIIYYTIRKGRLELKILKEKAEAIDKEHDAKGIKSRRCSD